MDENHEGGEALREASLEGMRAKRSHDTSSEDSDNQPAGQLCGPKQCRTQCDDKYDAIFELLEAVEKHSERMELRAMENQKEAFEQAQRALDSYNVLSEKLIHAIVNIGGSNDMSK